MSRDRRRAFTLLEVLLVIAILAVLAAAIIPQFSSSTSDAKTSSLKLNLRTIRIQIELYKNQHNGTFPAFAAFVDQLTGPTDIHGDTTGTDLLYGPYLPAPFPTNPFNDSSKVVKVAGAGFVPKGVVAGGAGWQYDETTGRFYPNNAEAYQAGSLQAIELEATPQEAEKAH